MTELKPGPHLCMIGKAHLTQSNPVHHVHEKLLLILAHRPNRW